ncbi:MAG: Rab3 GTPase-activating protein catalytic subunit-domain-containing protein [Benniella sp.]|nr:MAG: Rab3 GTPase-activating protein catalytic subunit-domain-containing protein [Benniella sp.]
MEPEDLENFEFIDYTTSGPWEKFIVQIEDCLKQWGLVHNSFGVFNPDVMPTTEGVVDLDQELALALNDGQEAGGTATTESVKTAASPSSPALPSKVYQHDTTITLEDASYTLTYRYHPAKARIAAGVERIDLDFLPPSLEGQEHHILHRWTALTHILVLAPASTDSVIIDLGSAKLLLSSFAIAFQNTGCNIPVFVPTGSAKNKTYTGLSIQPQLSQTRDSELGLEETAEDQAIEVRFNTSVVPYPPAHYTNLAGIIDLFIERMGLETDPTAMESGLSDSEGHSHEVKEQIYASALLSYYLDNRYDDEWRQWSEAADGNERRSDVSPSERTLPRLPVGPVHDPLKSLQLFARFASAPSTVYLDSKNLTEMDANLANIWILKALFKSDDYGLLSGILEDVTSSWTTEIHNKGGMDEKSRTSEKDQSSYVSLLRKGARIIQGTVAMVDAVDVEDIVRDLFSQPFQPPAKSAATVIQGHSRDPSESNIERVVPAEELALHFRHATTVPYNSFLWKMLQHLVDVMSPHSHITYATSFMGFLKALWADLLKKFSEHWETRTMIPWVQVFKEPDVEDPEGTDTVTQGDTGDRDVGANVPAIDLRFNLLHQKLSMINCCIARDHALHREDDVPSSPSTDDTTVLFSATSSPVASPKPGTLASSAVIHEGGIEQEGESTKGAEAQGRSNQDPKVSLGSLSDATLKLEQTLITQQEPLELARSSSQRSEAQNSKGTDLFKGATLLETGLPLVIPKLQEPGYMTEDMIQEQEDLFESLGSSADAAKTRAEVQCAQLLSDMSAFKASNPGCVLGDFIRWHSPKDWDDEKSQMSARMAESGNFWQELWERSEPLAAGQQVPLFDHSKEAQRALAYLNTLSSQRIFALLAPTIFLLAYDTLATHPVASVSQHAAKALSDLSQELVEFPWDELATGDESLDLNPIIAKFKDTELVIGRFIALVRKLSGQYNLAERIMEAGESVVEDGSERDSVYELFASAGGGGAGSSGSVGAGGPLSQPPFPKPTCREFVIETFDPSSTTSSYGERMAVSSGDTTGWHARPLQRRMYACFRDSEVRVVEAIAKDGMFM